MNTGWQLSGIELYARFRLDPSRWVGKQMIAGVWYKLNVLSFDAGHTWYSHSYNTPTPAHPHFPYGEDVLPD